MKKVVKKKSTKKTGIKKTVRKSTVKNESKLFTVGKKYFIRTVTNYIVGKCEELICEHEHYFVRLSLATWVGDTGRFYNAMKDRLTAVTASELEPFADHDVLVNIGSIADFIEYKHELPTQQK